MKTYPQTLWHALPVLLILYFVMAPEAVHAQKQVVQLSGLVTKGDSLDGLAAVSVFVPLTTRGTYSNKNGFFSLPVLPGDSIVIAALGYQKQHIIIPESYASQSYSVVIQLQASNTELPTVNVMPWATERELKIAIAKVKLVEEKKLEIDMGPLQYKSVLHGPPLDAEGNAKHAIGLQLKQLQSRYMITNGIRIF